MLFNLDTLTDGDEQKMLKAMQFFQLRAVADKNDFMKSSSTLYVNSQLNVTQQYKDLFKEFIAMDVKTFDNVSEIVEDIQQTSEFEFNFSNLSNDTKMLAVGFTSFSALWLNYFSRTPDMKPFYNLNGESVFVHYLYADDDPISIGYSEKFNCHVINLQLRWKKTIMTIFLPKEGYEFAMEDTDCICDEIREEIELNVVKMDRKTIKLWIPEFSVHTKISMKHLLSALGMDGLFDEESGRCTRILENTNNAVALDDFYQICIFNATPNQIHKIRDPSWRDGWEEMVCDRPFIYSVTNEISGKKIILCQGVVHELN
ncbi:protein Z-dependent protease inhibitor-like protein [Leptotrombidium deliense]|uniref:Protein Z-dependent protease inhibitor-like protein n=1 Tax=Leptotrombidium deliense TaxID=299467 RepID=A0A443SMP1_9ACAR|nr:protein Z-dependent protease inhibitor-like protein [Leptotrombidium deliense]